MTILTSKPRPEVKAALEQAWNVLNNAQIRAKALLDKECDTVDMSQPAIAQYELDTLAGSLEIVMNPIQDLKDAGKLD